ncbi:MAG: hypothetical protein AAB807_01245 [Patescibacteria group bacterium]|mgnify:CR=1 FL=1
MMNLLPLSEQNKIARERLFRFSVAAGLISFFILLAAIFLLLPSYLFLFFQSKELARKLEIEKQSPELKKAESIEAAIKNFSRRINALNANKIVLEDPFREMAFLIEEKPAGMLINSFSYEKGKKDKADALTVAGYAKARDSLLRFAETLEKNSAFSRVYSPVANILSKEEIEFSLILDLAENKNEE